MDQVLTIAGTQYTLAGDRLRISHRGDTMLDVSLSPVLDGKTVRIDRWDPAGPDAFVASLRH